MAPDDTHRASRLRVSIVDDDGRPLGAAALAAWLQRVAPVRARGAVTVALVSDRRIRALNRRYRGVDASTDVLSFPAAGAFANAESTRISVSRGAEALRHDRRSLATLEPSQYVARGFSPAQKRTPRAQGFGPAKQSVGVVQGFSPEHSFLGDIVIARGVAARQARAAGHSERTEWRVLALHGLLHLLGYDHERDHGEMRRVETRLRRKGGLRESLSERGAGR
jgi:ssRNA-specific RNase YbeY (16S rRNA maturation enzyme)